MIYISFFFFFLITEKLVLHNVLNESSPSASGGVEGVDALLV